MTWQELLTYCLAKPGAWQDEPWDGDVVAKVGSKIFAFLGSPQITWASAAAQPRPSQLTGSSPLRAKCRCGSPS